MKIKQILNELSNLLHSSKDQLVIEGVSTEFCSYRGHYSELCVEQSNNQNLDLSEFCNKLEDQIGKVFYGYKGGEYEMSETTELYIADYGRTGEKVVGISKSGDTISFVTEKETW